MEEQPTKDPWSVLLDKIAFGILNWKSTLRGWLRLSVPVTGVIAALQSHNPGAHNYAEWLFYIAVGSEAIKSFTDPDKSGTSATSVDVSVQSITIPNPPASDAAPK